MSSLLLAVLCLVLGKLLQGVRQFPESSAQTLNAYVIYLALPALILLQIPKVPLSSEVLVPVLFAWVIMGFSTAITWTCARLLRWPPAITGALLLVTVLGNTSFIGLPLIEAHLGPDALPYAILYDQLGTFIALNTLGIAIAGHYSSTANHQAAGQSPKRASFWQTVLRFPPFCALLVGFALHSVALPWYIEEMLQKLAATLVPVVMLAVGLQWKLRIERKEYPYIVFALIFILLVKPFFTLLLLQPLDIDPPIARTIVLSAAMPAMISTSALALMYQLAPRLVSTIIGYSLALAFLTVWLWKLLVIQWL